MQSILEWAREVMALSRRPYGVDHFDLVLAVRSTEGVRSLRFDQVRALSLYDDSLAHQVFERLAHELREAGEQVVHVAAGLFSWGDALHTVLGPQDQPAAI